MAGWTNRGKKELLRRFFQNDLPTNVYIALVTSAAAPGPDTNVFSELTEIAAGNGYTTGGYQMSLNATDFPTATEDDALDLAKVIAKIVSWLATGGPIPSSGDGARYAVMLDDNATVANREVWQYWDLSSNRSVLAGITLELKDLETQGKEA
jgi:hypothetical protein